MLTAGIRLAASRLAALVLLSLPAPALAADGVGVRSISVVAPERAQPLAVTLWYPARDGGTPERVGENAVFEGVQAWRDADIADGAFPVVLFAHGGLRAAPNQSGWIGADLASRGMIVAAVQPSRPATPQAAVAESWRRAADLSATLTALEADPATAAHAVPGQAAVVGGFLGGAAGLALAGARLDAERFARSCGAPARSPDCAWFAAVGVDLHAVDPATLTRSGLDPRIATVVAIDPELTASFAPDSLSDVEAQVAVVNLGAPGTIARYLDALGLQAAMPGATYIALPDASPMDAMAVCRPLGAEILAAEGEDDAICRGNAAAREHAHAELATRIAEALGAR
jgi:predicted dienelactone hydrolase